MTTLTTTTDVDDGQPYGPRVHWTACGSGGNITWIRHTWTENELAEHLADALREGACQVEEAEIVNENNDPIGHLVSPARMKALRALEAIVEEYKDQPKDSCLHPAIQGPDIAGLDHVRMDIDPIIESLAWAMAIIFRTAPRDAADAMLAEAAAETLTAKDVLARHRTWLIGPASSVAAQLTLWPDDRGLVPIRGMHRRSDHDVDVFWQLAEPTPARGLFVRKGTPQIWGDTFTVVTGSGFQVRAGFLTPEIASEYAVAIAETAPGIDWRVTGADLKDFPMATRRAVAEENARWTFTGRKNDSATIEPAAQEATR